MTNSAIIRSAAEMLAGGAPVWLGEGASPVLPVDAGAVVESSGSTGHPKRVVLSRAALVAAAESAHARLGGPMTWHLTLPGRYVAGFMVVVRALVAGREVVEVSSDLSGLRPSGEGDVVSVVPTQLHRALVAPDSEVAARLAAFEAVLVGGAALQPDLRGRAEDAGIRVIETYGMSETCGGCVWDGIPLPGVDVSLRPVTGIPDPAGAVEIGGPMLFDGYLNEPQLTAESLVDGRFRTSDWARWDGDRLVVGGRLDDIVITGGINVDLADVRRALASLDQEAVVLAVDDEEWGSRIILFATRGTLESWREWLAPTLGRAALPRQFVALEAIPRTAGGKPDRAALLEWVQS